MSPHLIGFMVIIICNHGFDQPRVFFSFRETGVLQVLSAYHQSGGVSAFSFPLDLVELSLAM